MEAVKCMYFLMAKKLGCSPEVKSLGWIIVLSQILFISRSYLIKVIRCGRKNGFSVVGASRQ